MLKKFMVSSAPHIRSGVTVPDIMLDVLIALSPAAVMGAFYFGFPAILVMALSVCSCVFFEFLFQKAMKRDVQVSDLSAAVTGLLLAFNMPSTAPVWMPVVGAFFAIIIIKQLFGGIGQNFINPALGARAFLLAAYPAEMTNFSALTSDAVSTATPLALLKEGTLVPGLFDITDALIGKTGGCIGETCAAALIIGGVYLIFRKVISWRIPVVYIATVFILTWVLGRNGMFTGYPQYEIFAGGLMLGAFFMATDYTTSPMAPVGQLVMGLGCGIITVLIRVYGNYPEGVSYSILLMNLTVPLIDKFTKPKIYGEVRKNA